MQEHLCVLFLNLLFPVRFDCVSCQYSASSPKKVTQKKPGFNLVCLSAKLQPKATFFHIYDFPPFFWTMLLTQGDGRQSTECECLRYG